MIRAELKNLFSIEHDLATYFPDDAENFGLWIRILIGPVGSEAEESFDILVCTPNWLRESHLSNGPAWGRHMLIVNEYDFPKIRAFVAGYVQRLSAETWGELAQKLSRVAAWEFEDYQPSKKP